MLPTLVFILWAYGMYALISALAGRKGTRFRGRGPGRRYGWLALVAGAVAGLGLAAVLAQSFDDRHQNLKLAGFMGTVWAEGWPDRVEQRLDYPPIKSTAAGDQPAYALLHPGTSPADLAQEKAKTGLKPRPAKKPKTQKASAPQAKGAKVMAQKPKKDQAAAKSKPKTPIKKKKPVSPAPATDKKAAG